MSIVYEKKTRNSVYCVYKFKAVGYGVSIICSNGDSAMLPSFTTSRRAAEEFVSHLCEEEVPPMQLHAAARAYCAKHPRVAV